MAVKLISDVHGEYEAMAEALCPDDTAVMLGDYLNLIDFRTLDGILAQVYTTEEITAALELLARGEKDVVRKQIRQIVDGKPGGNRKVRKLIVESYDRFFESIPCRCFMLYGNTDDPQLMGSYCNDGVELIEAGVRRIDGQRFGFVSGSPRGPWTVGLPGEMEAQRYDRLVESLGPVDVLCTHYPPALPQLTWDLVAGRDEVGSTSLLAYIDRNEPSYHYFGHVHNPRENSLVRGSTRLLNVGYFKRKHEALVHPDPPA